jgi:hypothetical protein
MLSPGDEAHCPRCDRTTPIHTDKPWLGSVCLECGTTI